MEGIITGDVIVVGRLLHKHPHLSKSRDWAASFEVVGVVQRVGCCAARARLHRLHRLRTHQIATSRDESRGSSHSPLPSSPCARGQTLEMGEGRGWGRGEAARKQRRFGTWRVARRTFARAGRATPLPSRGQFELRSHPGQCLPWPRLAATTGWLPQRGAEGCLLRELRGVGCLWHGVRGVGVRIVGCVAGGCVAGDAWRGIAIGDSPRCLSCSRCLPAPALLPLLPLRLSPFAAASCGDCGSTSPKSHSPSPIMSATAETRQPPTCFTTESMQLVLPSSATAAAGASPSAVAVRTGTSCWADPGMSCLSARGVLTTLVRLSLLPARSSRGVAASSRGDGQRTQKRGVRLGALF